MKLNFYSIGIFLLLILIVLIKIPHLSLPYFWDEAWSYGPAVHYMYQHKLSLLPNSLPMEFSRGHPLLFYFLSAASLKLFGSGFTASHIFPLLISLSVVLSLYFFTRHFFNEEIAFFSALFLSCQALFIAQANFILPDMFLALCTIGVFYGYLRPNKLIYFLAGSALIFTKETGIIIFAFFLAWETALFIKEKKSFNFFFRRILFLLSPLPLVILFFIVQKIRVGWFFYPEHVYSIELPLNIILQKFHDYLQIVFIGHSKFLILIVCLVCLIILIKRSFFKNNSFQSGLLLMFFLFSLFYLFCMSFLFFNLRYSLTVLPFVAIILSSVIYYCLQKKLVLFRLILILLILPVAFNAYLRRSSDNETLGYIDVIRSNKEATDYLVRNNYSDSVIYVPFVMGINLNSTIPGYVLSEEKIFKNLVYKDGKDVQLYIFVDSRALEKEQLIKKHNLILEKEFRSGNAWTAIYKLPGKSL